jgi:hypothetical protein
MPSSGMLRLVALVITDVLEELVVCLRSVHRLLVTVNVVPPSPILVVLMMEAPNSSETSFLKQLHGVTSQKTAFLKFITRFSAYLFFY